MNIHFKSKHISKRILNSHLRFFSNSTIVRNNNEKLRIAIVGAGASGMSTALHLAPLAKKGLIAMPIDIYEKSSPSDVHPHVLHPESGDEDFHPGSGHVGREVGIGIWSTALVPFLRKKSKTHLDLIKDLEEKGQYVGRVGYRTPSGNWLTRGKLNTSGLLMSQIDNVDKTHDPALLFIREKDFLSSLRNACKVEESNNGTIRIHTNTEVKDVALPDTADKAFSGFLKFSDDNNVHSSDSYHLIISADGMQSFFRKNYAGYSNEWERKTGITEKLSQAWEEHVFEGMNVIEDRKYTVFRGNAPLSDTEAHMDGFSFQTWGEGKSMRFAAVGMSHPTSNKESKRQEEQVWFATICDSETKGIKNADERKQLLVKSFKNWHDPVASLIESTPSDEIYMERGVAHKHSTFPIFNLSHIIDYQDQRRSSVSPGPILMFTGDAAMTVDPVLAQGFTVAMESAADLAQTLDQCLSGDQDGIESIRSNVEDALLKRNQRRYERMLCLLRATELVQAISQPSDTLSGIISNRILRPAMMIVPSFVKETIFSYMIKYSLGLYGSQTLYSKGNSDITKASQINSNQ